jgi:hypothetical protein
LDKNVQARIALSGIASRPALHRAWLAFLNSTTLITPSTVALVVRCASAFVPSGLRRDSLAITSEGWCAFAARSFTNTAMGESVARVNQPSRDEPNAHRFQISGTEVRAREGELQARVFGRYPTKDQVSPHARGIADNAAACSCRLPVR